MCATDGTNICKYSMIGDGNCDDECFVEACSYDEGDCSSGSYCSSECLYLKGNGVCDYDCDVEECEYDGGDCYCSPGCTDEKYNEVVSACSEDDECNTEACSWHDKQCGDCAQGCMSDMIENGECDTECYVAGCNYDSEDCNDCSPGCNDENKALCSSNCLTLKCGWNQDTLTCNSNKAKLYRYTQTVNYDWTLSDIEASCESTGCVIADLLSTTSCIQQCNNTHCGYSLGLCSSSCDSSCSVCYSQGEGYCLECADGLFQYYEYCLSECPYGHSVFGSTNICIKDEDNSNEDNPEEIFVAESGVSGDGTYSNPYNDISYAFTRTIYYYNQINLSKGTHAINPLESSVTFAYMDKTKPMYDSGKNIKSITIQPWVCNAGDSSNTICYSDLASILEDERPVISWTQLVSMTALKNTKLTILSINLVGSFSLVDSCDFNPYGYCSYCPLLKNIGTSLYDQKNTEYTTLPQSTDCNQYHTYNIIEVLDGATLNIESSIISDFRTEPFAVIRAYGKSTVNLNEVKFSNIRVYGGNQQAAVVSFTDCSDIPYGCGQFIYQTGTVSYLNNGFEIDTSLELNGFLYATEAELIEIDSVEFDYNIVYSESQKYSGLINLTNFKQLIISQSSFKHSIHSLGIINILGTVLLSTEVADNKYKDHYDTHIDLSSIVIENTLSYSALLIKGVYTKDLHNIKIVDTDITDSVCNGVIVIESATLEMAQAIGGQRAITINGNKYSYSISAKTLELARITINSSNLGSYGLIYSRNYGNFILDSIQLDNGNICSIYDCIVTELASDSTLYLEYDFSDSDPSTAYMSYINEFYTFELKDSDITNYEFNAGSGSIYLYSSSAYQSGSVSVLDTDISNIAGAKAGEGSVFTISVDFIVKVTNCNLNFNVNSKTSGYGVIYMYGDRTAEFSIKDSTFDGNSAASGAALYCSGAKSIEITNTDFLNNSAIKKTGGAISVSPNDESGLFITISSCTFTSNFATTYGGSISIENPSAYDKEIALSILDSDFTSNQANLGGSSIALLDQVFLSSSSIQNSDFEDNISNYADIYILTGRGVLTISDSSFLNNGGMDVTSSGIYAISVEDSEDSRSYVLIKDTEFSSNEGESVITVGGNAEYSSLITEGCKFRDNSGSSVRVIYGEYSDTGSTFISNEAESGPGINLKSKASVILQGTEFRSNSAYSIGGAIHISDKSDLSCTSCKFTSNSSEFDGGAIYIEQNSNFYLSSCSFTSNTSRLSGSAIYMTGCQSTQPIASSCIFTSNNAGSSGSVSLYSSQLSISSSKFYTNTASADGTPGIDVKDSVLKLETTEMYSQTSSFGAFLYSSINGKVEISECIFRDSSSESEGAFYIGSTELIMTSSKMYNLYSKYGAAIYVFEDSTVSISDTEFKDCTASESGVITLYGSRIEISNSRFSNLSLSILDCYNMDYIGITDSSFSDSSGYLGGVIYIEKSDALKITRSIFSRNSASVGGVIYSIGDLDSDKYTITSCQFEENEAEKAGAIFIIDSDLDIIDTTFTSNIASTSNQDYGQGGAIYLDCSEYEKCAYTISDSTFSSNSATFEGGAIKWTYNVNTITQTNNQFTSNSAIYGENLAAFGSVLTIEVQDKDTDSRLSSRKTVSTLEEIAPGDTMDKILIITLQDSLGQVITTDYSSVCEIDVDSEKETEYLGGVTQIKAVSGVYTFSSLVLYATPNTNINLLITTTSFESDSDEYDNILAVSVRDCIVGEEKSSNGCTRCQAGYYNFEAGANCEECPSNAKCLGGDKVYPEEGYWRASITSSKIFKCMYEYACAGGVETESQQGDCEEGYKGNLCQSCDSDYVRSGSNECSECVSKTQNTMILIGIALLIILVEVIMIRSSIRNAYEPKSLFSVYFKILVNYFLLMNIMSTFELNWPGIVMELFNVQSQVSRSTSQVISVDCSIDDESIEPFYIKLLILMLLPVIASIVIIIVWSIINLVSLIKYKKGVEHVLYKMLGSVITVFFLIHPQVLTYMFAAFNCMEIEEGEYWLMVDLDIECWKGDHTTYALAVALPGLIFWGLFIPAVCMTILIKQRNLLDNIRQKLSFGFLYLGFKKESFFWEFVILYRKVLLITYSVFMRNYSINAQALTVLLTLIVYLYIQNRYQPYATKDLNKLETFSILVSAATIYAGLYYLTTNISNFYYRLCRKDCTISCNIGV